MNEAQRMETAPVFDETVIRTENLSKVFAEETAVDHINLAVPPGSIFGFVGPSGCGKTTTVRLLLGIYKPSSGMAHVFKCQPQKFTRREQEKIGYIPQLFVLYPELTVWENLNFAASLYGVSWRRKNRLHELLELVELKGHENKLVTNISGGMQRRLSMAAALVHEPELVFMDEPTAGIDPVLRRTFWDYFARLKEEGHTLFVTTQYVGEAAHCDYVGVMFNGRLIALDTPTQLRRQIMGGDIIKLSTEEYLSPAMFSSLQNQPFLQERHVSRQPNNSLHMIVDDASATIQVALNWFQENDIAVRAINEYVLPFDDVFIKLVEEATDGEA
jgi:ABC-2 type transport system ATP-binding protein